MSDICELIDTYDDCLEVQNRVISLNRAKLAEAERRRNYEEMRRLRKTLGILYDERSELEELSASLKEYRREA